MESVRRNLLANPRQHANPYSVLFFWWTRSIFRKGLTRRFGLDDLYEPRPMDRSHVLGDRLEERWMHQLNKTKGRPSLIVAIVQTFWREYVYLAGLSVLTDVLWLSQPFLVGKFLSYFRAGSSMSHTVAVCYAGALLFVLSLLAIFNNQFLNGGLYNGMKVRVAVCSIVYRKALRLSQAALGKSSVGKVVNLLSNDVNRFDSVSLYINCMWSAPLLSMIVGYLLYLEVGFPGLFGIGVVFVIVPIQWRLSSIFRLQTALRTDERVRFMDEIISGVQVIKLYAWEIPFTKLIRHTRKLELNIVRKNSFVRGLYMTFLLFTTRMALFSTMLAMVLLQGSGQLTAEKVFVVSVYFSIVSESMSQMFVGGVAECAEALVSIRRLQNLLESEERDRAIHSNEADTAAVLAVNLTARWTPRPAAFEKKQSLDTNRPATLTDLNVNVKRGMLVGIVGPVGSGKTSFLHVLLGELQPESGSIALGGTVSYASQEPWVFPGSARQNILFGNDMNPKRYDAVVQMCDLVHDFENLVNGDRTIIGDRGASLSGGQRARINLARAMYREADIYLLDDPLSAVDSNVGQHIFDKCIGPSCQLAQQQATRILVTHQVHFLNDADWIIVLNEGKIEFQGEPKELATNRKDIAMMLQNNARYGQSTNVTINTPTSSIKALENLHKYAGLSMRSDSNVHSEEQVLELESSSKGKVKGSVGIYYLKYGGNWYVLIIIMMMFLITQLLASAADYWVSYWTALEETSHLHPRGIQPPIVDPNPPGYFSTESCIFIQSTILIGLFIFGLLRSIGLYAVCVRASQHLHDYMFQGIISTTMRFYETNPSGRILNRFSKDMGATDEIMPKDILDATQIIFNVAGVILVTAIVEEIFLIPVVVLGAVFIFLRMVYLKTSKNLKRLDGITRSPVFTHLSASLNGLPTIRAFGAQSVLIEEFDNHQDLHTACWYMYITTSSAFGLSLDIMCLVLLAVIICYFLLIENNTKGDQVGLAITQVMSLTELLQWGIRQSAEVSNHLMSVERILEYRDLEPERIPPQFFELPMNWPHEGRIEFRNVVYRYFAGGEPVLKGLSFVVEPREKIGIVGRTGAGKSSLISAIFRLAVIEGDILIDGLNTDSIKLSDLRSKISIIPQDPVLFSGTLRRNLDPFEEYSDERIWQALSLVELKGIADDLHDTVMPGGSNYSIGQRQLICLARAVLRNNRILVLDEATANVDPKTDFQIQQTIRKLFADCTVLTVAHRLYTIMDSDRVLVMNFGIAAEFATPHELLQQRSGIFYEMVLTLGPHELERMSTLAREKYESSINIRH